jgi:preprotein translocase subunit SecE
MSVSSDHVKRGGGVVTAYFREVVDEVRKVRWPNRRETYQYTMTVLAIAVIMFLLCYGFDYLVTQGFRLIGIGS